MDIDQLKENLKYDPETGHFIWLRSTSKRITVGSVAGRVTVNGYRQIQVDGVRKYAHVLAWLYMTGDWPNSDMDHINHNRDDNRWCNLRIATRTENNYNLSRTNNKLGLKGVHQRKKDGKYIAQIRISGKVTILAICDTPKEAKSIYDAKSRELHGEFYHNPD